MLDIQNRDKMNLYKIEHMYCFFFRLSQTYWSMLIISKECVSLILTGHESLTIQSV